MYFHELKSNTWITREDKPYFIRRINENRVHLLLKGIYPCHFTLDDFPTDFEPLTLPTLHVGDQVLYKKSIQGDRGIVTILRVDEHDELCKYVIKNNDGNRTWVISVELEPINY